MTCPFGCHGFLGDGTRCPGTLNAEEGAILDQTGEPLPARRWVREGCPRSVTVTYRIPEAQP